jgi:hypothetical protein
MPLQCQLKNSTWPSRNAALMRREYGARPVVGDLPSSPQSGPALVRLAKNPPNNVSFDRAYTHTIMLELHTTRRAFRLAFASDGTRIATSAATIATTTSSSIRLKAQRGAIGYPGWDFVGGIPNPKRSSWLYICEYITPGRYVNQGATGVV